MQKINVFWFRRDLRLHDNAGLYQALKSAFPVLPIFIFDKHILDKLEDENDKRVAFIYQQVELLDKELRAIKSSIMPIYATPLEAWKELTKYYNVQAVYSNHDYEPYASTRDMAIAHFLDQKKIPFLTFKDQVIFEKNEVAKDNNEPYTVFTPFAKKWRSKLNAFYLSSYPTEKYLNNLFKWEGIAFPSLSSMGFRTLHSSYPSHEIAKDTLIDYSKTRDYPAISGTSKLGIHLRFGTISIRELARKASELSDVFLTELIWRDFYQMILWNFPEVIDHSFKPAYDKIKWRNDEKEFEKWCNGQTGYPIVDAGMRELNTTGYMHNRVCMIVASFLTKHLLIDWRWGEAYFGKKLLDYDLAANNGGWQWAAGSGTDAAPYFRIFNPSLQTKKFDQQLHYIKKWVPEYLDSSYPSPIVEHEFARKRCLEAYKKALNTHSN